MPAPHSSLYLLDLWLKLDSNQRDGFEITDNAKPFRTMLSLISCVTRLCFPGLPRSSLYSSCTSSGNWSKHCLNLRTLALSMFGSGDSSLSPP